MPKFPKSANNRRAINTENNMATDENRSFVDWGKLDMGALRLKCSEYKLVSTGKRPALQARLVQHFQDSRRPDQPIEGTTSNEAPPDTNTANTNVSDSDNFSNTSNANELIIAEIRALRSEIGVMKKMQSSFEQFTKGQDSAKQNKSGAMTQPESDVDLTVVRNSASSQPKHGFQLPEHTFIEGSQSDQHQSDTAQGRSIFSQPRDNSVVIKNLFIPPSLKNTTLKKIEKKEFVDFEELLPYNQMASNHITAPCIDIDMDSSTLKFRKNMVKKVKVDNLNRWMAAWNNFMQAYLHYHPESFFDLFCYQNFFCQLASRYKFEACFLYDRDLRISIANQISLAPEQRTAHWGEINEEIRNLYLQDNLLPACYYCKAPGHFSTSCPEKSK